MNIIMWDNWQTIWIETNLNSYLTLSLKMNPLWGTQVNHKSNRKKYR